MTQNQAKKYYYHLIIGEVVFQEKDSDEPLGIRLNGIVQDEQQNLPVRVMGKAQQILQMNFRKKIPDDNMIIVDVILQGFTFLGHMTEEEFYATPEGTKLVEKKPSLKVVPGGGDGLAHVPATESDAMRAIFNVELQDGLVK